MWVDLNDAVMVFAAGRLLAEKHLDKIDDFYEHAPEAVERAGKDLGMFMGIEYLAEKVGIDPEEGRQAMMDLVTSASGPPPDEP